VKTSWYTNKSETGIKAREMGISKILVVI